MYERGGDREKISNTREMQKGREKGKNEEIKHKTKTNLYPLWLEYSNGLTTR